jgi:serine/threonine protein kinase
MEEYNFIKELGKGDYGRVIKARKNEKTIAVKIVEFGRKDLLDKTLREVDLLKELSTPKCHPSLACFYDYHYDNKTLYIEMEYIEGSTLNIFAERFFSKQNNQELKLYKNLIAIIYDICTGLEFMHGKGIIHRDIKPENIIITPNNQPKLIDLGLACNTIIKEKGNSNMITFEKKETCILENKSIVCCKGYAGTPIYASPETLLSKVSFFSSDIFSLGASFFRAATGKEIYYDRDKGDVKKFDELLKKIQDPNFQYPKLETPNYALNVLVTNMIVKNPLQRISLKEIMDSIKN